MPYLFALAALLTTTSALAQPNLTVPPSPNFAPVIDPEVVEAPMMIDLTQEPEIEAPAYVPATPPAPPAEPLDDAAQSANDAPAPAETVTDAPVVVPLKPELEAEIEAEPTPSIAAPEADTVTETIAKTITPEETAPETPTDTESETAPTTPAAEPIVDDTHTEDVAETATETVVEVAEEAEPEPVVTPPSYTSAWDAYLAGNKDALTRQQKRGMRLFKTKAQCSSCHLLPEFSDGNAHDIGLPNAAMPSTTAPLRNVGTKDSFHGGRFESLAEVIDHYDHKFISRDGLARQIKKLHLSDSEKVALITFLNSLTDADKTE